MRMAARGICLGLLGLLLASGCPERREPSSATPDSRAGQQSASKQPTSRPARPRRRRGRLPEQVKHDPEHVLGGERGLDHVGVAVQDLAGARAAYEKLGFTNGQEGKLPNGLQNVNFYFGDSTYLELLTVYDAKKNPWVASFIKQHKQGAMFFMQCVYAYTHTANFLRRRGFKVGAPLPGHIQTKGGPTRRPGRRKAPMWLNFFVEGDPLPGNMSFIAYNRRMRNFTLAKLKDPAVRQRSFSHPNTVQGLHSAWIALPEVAPAAALLKKMGFKQLGAVRDARLQARGLRVAAGAGNLVLLQPRRKGRGPLARFLRRRKQGIIGLGFLVAQLDTARKVIQQGTGQDLAPYDGWDGRSIRVPPTLAYDVVLELVQQPATAK